jgi:FkbM family methyltransferase
MHWRSLIGKLRQISGAPPSLWRPFIAGWLKRRANGFVPCIAPGARQLLQVPTEDFYRSYSFFSESSKGRRELAFVLGKLRPKETLYDIGGYRGVFSAAANAKLKGDISVHVFEPIKTNYDAIERIFALNRFPDFRVVPLALSNGSTLSGSIDEINYVFKSREPDMRQTDMKSTSIDQYIASGAAPPSFIKMDIDGFELDALQGGGRCLKENRPRLWLELHPQFLRDQGKSSEQVLKLLRDAGYSLEIFEDYNANDQNSPYHVWCV